MKTKILMKKLKTKFYMACQDIASQNTLDVKRMTQEQFNQALEGMMKGCWTFIEKHFSPLEDENEI